MNWIQNKNIIAFPYGWQYPAKTEQHAYEKIYGSLPYNPDIMYIGFPWATLIDLLNNNQPYSKEYIKALSIIPNDSAKIKITVSQHILSLKYLQLFKEVGITDIFWPHNQKNQRTVDGIRIHPFPLYPVRCLDSENNISKPAFERKYIYSFIGAYDPNWYISDTRYILNQMHHPNDAVVINRGVEWFFKNDVYDQQIYGKKIEKKQSTQLEKDAMAYREVLQESVFSLCPSGSGPNSIRLWESLGFGCIPVILSDSLQLPGDPSLWTQAAIFIKENSSSLAGMESRLREIANNHTQLTIYQESGKKLWDLYGHQNFIYDILLLANKHIAKTIKKKTHTPDTCSTNYDFNTPKITIVTPSFNQAEYLEECIDSILSQNYPNLEYIIMDGGSTDGSTEIIKKYEKYLAYWQSKPDGGQYSAINEGFRRSTGEIMTWLNSDDKLHPGALEKVAHIFTTKADVEWIMGRPNSINSDGTQARVFDYLPLWSREKYLVKEYRNPYIQQEGTFWHRSLWEKSGGYLRTDLQMAADLELWTRFFRHTQLYTVDALLGAFRKQPNQKTANFLEVYHQEAEYILDQERVFFIKESNKKLLPAPSPIYLTKNA